MPYNQPGAALDMLTRFLKGQDFHDRPLVTFASTPMPEKVVSGIASSEEASVDMLKQSTWEKDPSLVSASGLPKELSSTGFTGSAVLGMVVAISSVAFVVGVWVARRHAALGSGNGVSSQEVRPLKAEGAYGSLQNL